MRDQRIPLIRKTLDSLIESLEATLRLKRWSGSEEIPEPLERAAGRLLERLGAADRLATQQTTYRGAPQDVARVTAMLAALKQLDAAYVSFRQQADKNAETAAATLEEAVTEVKNGMDAWASP